MSSSGSARAAVVSCSRPGRTDEVHNGQPSGADTTWMFPPWWRCFPLHHRSTPRVGPGVAIRSVEISVPSTITCVWPAALAASNAPCRDGLPAASTTMASSR